MLNLKYTVFTCTNEYVTYGYRIQATEKRLAGPYLYEGTHIIIYSHPGCLIEETQSNVLTIHENSRRQNIMFID